MILRLLRAAGIAGAGRCAQAGGAGRDGSREHARHIRLRASRRKRVAAALAFVLATLTPGIAVAAGAANNDAALFEALRAGDLRLAAIGYRLATANAPLCERLQPATGLQLHTLDQFDARLRDAARAHFGFAGPVAIEAVVAGSPAEAAGLRADDTLVRVGSVTMAELPGEPGTTERLVAAQLAIAALAPDQPIAVEGLRAGAPVHATIRPLPACRSRFELRFADDMNASADGSMVQISSRFFDVFPDAQAAAAIAHEFAHNILHHRDRLRARGVDFGLLSGFGGNVKYFRQTEIEADLLGVALLANAGYDPQSAIAFWKVFGPKYAGGILRSRSHPDWRDRIATIEAEIARIAADPRRPFVPAVVATRDQPLGGDWRALLVRHR